MKAFRTTLIAFLAIAFIVAGCSHEGSPILPITNEGMVNASTDAHNLLAIYTFICDPASSTVEVIPLRHSEFHLNALKFLEPPPYVHLTIEGPPKFEGKILDIDIGLRNPYLGQDQYTGFDVCGIVFTHGSYSGFQDPDVVMSGEDDTRLLNADGHSRWWNPAEFPHGNTIFNYIDGLLGTPADQADFNTTVNGYKYFADGLDKNAPLTTLDLNQRGMFRAGHKNIRHYTIDFSGGLIFNYAIDACWAFPKGEAPYDVPDDFPPKANRPEAYHASVTELENSLFYDDYRGNSGGELKLLVDVWDHYNAALNIVYAESLAGLNITDALTPVGGGAGYSTYELDFTGGTLTKTGKAELLITVQSEASGYGGILPGKAVCAFFKYTFNIREPFGWARSWGGNKRDTADDIALDPSGNTYITGQFRGTSDFDPGPGVDEHVSSDNVNDIFLSKFDASGIFQWARTWGGVYTDAPLGVAVDGFGNIYVVGNFSGKIDFDPGPGTEEHFAYGTHFFLSKFNSNGDFIWVRIWKGQGYNPWFGQGDGVAVDSSGDIYVTGGFRHTVDFDPGPGIEEHTSNGGWDAFLSKFDSSGNFMGVRTWGSVDYARGSGVATDSTNGIYVMGIFGGTVDFDPGPGVEEHTSHYWSDIFLSKFDSGGSFQWAQTWGGEGEGSYERGYGIAADNYNNIYITGRFKGTVDFDPSSGEDYHSAYARDVFLTKFDSSGNYQWAKTWGGIRMDAGLGVAVDGSGNIFIAGYFDETVDFDPGPGTDNHSTQAQTKGFLSKFDSTGDYQWVRTLGSETEIAHNYGSAVAVDAYGNIYVAGSFAFTADFDPGPGIDEHTSSGHYEDVYLIKFSSDGYW